MKDLQFVVYLGSFLRNMHRWSAHGMVICVFLHMCRVFYTGVLQEAAPVQLGDRRGAFPAHAGLSFTGYLLPWDQLAYWAITVGTNIGGYAPAGRHATSASCCWAATRGRIGAASLLRAACRRAAGRLVTLLTMVHFWRVRKDGGLSRPVWKLKEPRIRTARYHRRTRNARAADHRSRLER